MYIMENPRKMDDLGVPPCQETPIYTENAKIYSQHPCEKPTPCLCNMVSVRLRMSQSEHLSFVVSDVKMLMTLHLTKKRREECLPCNWSPFHNIKPAMLMPPSDSLKPLGAFGSGDHGGLFLFLRELSAPGFGFVLRLEVRHSQGLRYFVT